MAYSADRIRRHLDIYTVGKRKRGNWRWDAIKIRSSSTPGGGPINIMGTGSVKLNNGQVWHLLFVPQNHQRKESLQGSGFVRKCQLTMRMEEAKGTDGNKPTLYKTTPKIAMPCGQHPILSTILRPQPNIYYVRSLYASMEGTKTYQSIM